ncbi:MAG: T9SS type A sorting domain-containing protein [Bacteroidetes bacterium]|nr:T9SS type A sorting domain-containing protein [Bacteroidota bacterium]
MKKTLLIAFGFAIAIGAGAQTGRKKIDQKYLCAKPSFKDREMAEPTTSVPLVRHERKSPLKINPKALVIADVATMGHANNAYGGFTRPGREIIDWSDASGTGVLTCTHRACPACGDGSSGSGEYRVDYSIDGGTTWKGQLGGIYIPSPDFGRYPAGVIYNVAGNTIADSCFISYHGPSCTTCAGAGDEWIHYLYGTAVLGDAANTAKQGETNFTANVASHGLIPDCMIEANGVTWVSDMGYDGTDYTDSIMIRKGVWNTSTRMHDYTTIKIPFPVASNTAGAKMFGTTNVAFSSNGQIGYITATGHDTSWTFNPDSNYTVNVFKTTNGGNTWSGPIRINVNCVGAQLGTSDTLFNPAFQLDGAVDKNGNLHLILAIAPWATGGAVTTVPGTWGEFSIITDGSADNAAAIQLLDKPMTFRGTFAAITEDGRGQVSINKAADKVFYIWFDTDTNAFPGGGNTNPNAVCRYYDVTAGQWGAVTNLTAGSAAEGVVTFGYVSYWAEGTASPYTLHIGYQFMTGTDTQPVDFHYLTGVTVATGSTSAGSPCGSLAVHELNSDISSFNLYPNPTTGVSTIEITMKEAGKAVLEVSNMVGQTIYSTSKELGAGTHTFSVDASKWNSGVYFYTVKTGNSSVTKKLVRE